MTGLSWQSSSWTKRQLIAAALGSWALAMTVATAWLLVGQLRHRGAARELDVERINVREADGTLRLVIANRRRMPGIIIAGREYPHPNRSEAGLIFYNDEGTENGGLIFDGGWRAGRATNGGSLTFDRWRQDQTIQVSSVEDGPAREAALRINDRPDAPADFTISTSLLRMPPGPARAAALKRAGFEVAERAYLGRTRRGTSELVLRDQAGRPRLRVVVEGGGQAHLDFLGADGSVTKTLTGDD